MTGLKNVIYYTDNSLPESLAVPLQKQLRFACGRIPIITVSQKQIDFGDIKLVIGEIGRSYESICRQILLGLERAEGIVYFAEHDIIYHSSHFDFAPPVKDCFFYNENVWKLRASDGQAVYYDTTGLSMLISHKDILISQYEERLDLRINHKLPKGCGHEPGFHISPRGVGINRAVKFRSEHPCIEIRHGNNFTPRDRFDPAKNKIKNDIWQMADEIPFWGKTKGRFEEFIKELEWIH